jgi:hypothetical protein
VRAGHAYVRLDGTDESPAVEVAAVAADGTEGMMGDAFTAESATVTVEVTGGAGRTLRVVRDGAPVEDVAIDGDVWSHSFDATVAAAGSGPLGTFWRVDVVDPATDTPTVITNPVFVGAPTTRLGPDLATRESAPGDAAPSSPGSGAEGAAATVTVDDDADGGVPVPVWIGAGAAVVLAGVVLVGLRRRSHRPPTG